MMFLILGLLMPRPNAIVATICAGLESAPLYHSYATGGGIRTVILVEFMKRSWVALRVALSIPAW